MDKEMELLLSEKEIKIGDKTVVVKRIALLDTIRLASHISDVVGRVVNSSTLFESALGKIMYNGRPEKDANGNVIEYKDQELQEDIDNIKMYGIIEIFGIIGEDGVDVLKDLIVKSTNMSDEEVENIDCVEGIDIISTIYEVNKGFFVKCMSKLKEKLAKKKITKKTK